MVEEGLRIPSALAWQNTSTGNIHSLWSLSLRKNESAVDRLRSRVFLTKMRPSFRIACDEPIFCMGACYVRMFEKSLYNLGFNIKSLLRETPTVNIMNRYNTFSILNELKWALDPDLYPFPKDSLIPKGNDIVDPHLSWEGFAQSRSLMQMLRTQVTETVSQIRQCRLVILMLGQNEVWFDKEVGVYLAEPPPFTACRRNPNRYEVHRTSYQENSTCLQEIYELLSSHCGEKLRIVVGVAPNPVQVTFTEEDIVIANSYAKAMLQTVAKELANKFRNVDYYPVFENSTNSNQKFYWEKNLTNVTSELVEINSLNFLAHYLDEEEAKPFRIKLSMLANREGNFPPC